MMENFQVDTQQTEVIKTDEKMYENSNERTNMLMLMLMSCIQANNFGGSQNEDKVVRKGKLSTLDA